MIYIIIGALIIGLTLGLMGSGGSILTVPVLTYLLGHNSKAAIAESLAIVGGIALIAVLPYAKSKEIDWRSVAYFGIPGMAGTYAGAWLSEFVPGAVQLTLFAIVMLVAAFMMFRRSANELENQATTKPQAYWKIALEGVAVGILTGLVGVGGGFLIVPALVVLAGLSMRVAIGTSLAVIALKSLTGFYKYLDVLEEIGASIDWWAVTAFIAIGVVGSLAGKIIGSRVNQDSLRQAFAVFLVVMGVFVLGKELPRVLEASPMTTACPTLSNSETTMSTNTKGLKL